MRVKREAVTESKCEAGRKSHVSQAKHGAPARSYSGARLKHGHPPPGLTCCTYGFQLDSGKIMTKGSAGLATTIGLIIGAVGVLAPISWDWYKSRSALELQLLSNSLLVSPVTGAEKLNFVYDGQPVTSLTRLEFGLANTGRTPIREADIVSPPVINLQPAKIVDAQIGQLRPGNLQVQSTENNDGHSISLRFPLLNPGDSFHLTLLVSAGRPEISSDARIAGISELGFVDRSDTSKGG
jgi:hypothetical protein